MQNGRGSNINNGAPVLCGLSIMSAIFIAETSSTQPWFILPDAQQLINMDQDLLNTEYTIGFSRTIESVVKLSAL